MPTTANPPMPKSLTLTAEARFDVQAAQNDAEKTLPRFRMVAYTGEAVIGADQRRQTRRDRSASIHDQTLGVLGQKYEDEQNRQAGERAQAELEAEQALIAARREWEAAIAEAKSNRAAIGVGSDGPIPGAPDLSGLSDMLEREAERIGVRGTFNAAAIQGLMTDSGVAERTAKATEDTARNTKRIERAINDNAIAFA